jgi:hypothetical protein
VLPWSSFWGRNFFVEHWPALLPWIANDFVRGAVSGLGMVNIAAGIADLVPVFLTRDPVDAQQARGIVREDSGLARRSAEREGGL